MITVLSGIAISLIAMAIWTVFGAPFSRYQRRREERRHLWELAGEIRSDIYELREGCFDGYP